MTLRRSHVAEITPKGLTDALDTTHAFPGAMTALRNLIPDPGADGMWVCRPASSLLTNFPALTSPGFISVMKVVGNVAYGLINSGLNSGRDEPFIYNISTGQFTPITGQTAANTPASPNTTGGWLPPTVDVVGTKVIFTHPGFNFGAGFYIGWLDISNPAAAVWSAGNLTGAIQFTSPPTAVQQFNGRAYYAINNAVIFSDTTNPLSCTFGTQVVILGLNTNITALVGLPLTNQLQGGIIQSLMAFTGTSAIYQILGDASSTVSPISLNQLNVSTGTFSQNSVCATPQGLCFVSPEGLRFISYAAQISPPVGNNGKGIAKPIYNALVPSRVAIAYAGDVLRVSLQNSGLPNYPNQEFFYHLSLSRWSGPHTFPASLIASYGNTFVMAPIGVTGGLWLSNAFPTPLDTFTENGVALQWEFDTTLSPSSGGPMSMYSLQEMTADLALNSGDIYFFSFLDTQGNTIQALSLTGQGTANLWNSGNWGTEYWGSTAPLYQPVLLSFPYPVIFKRAQFSATGLSSAPFRFGGLATRVEVLGYVL